ncbi:MAG: dTMP kinase [Pseudomonadota bacterium]
MAPGRLITLEGGEGTGKSTQTQLLRDALAKHDISSILTREPGGPELSERIRDLILSARPKEPKAEFLLFAAARAEHITAVIQPALDQGDWVICDRYIDSTRVYQGDIEGINPDLIMAIEQFCVAPVLPDLTVILDLPVEVSAARVSSRGELTRFDDVGLARHEAIRQGFLRIAEREPERCVVINAAHQPDEVGAQLLDAVRQRLMKI